MEYLRAAGMTELDRRYRAADGEIDLIARDGETVVFVEVKYRPSGRQGDGLAGVTPAKRRRMTNAAQVWLTAHDALDHAARFDVIEITADGLLHIPNAFWPG